MKKSLPESYEDFLMDVHAEHYAGNDDDMSDNFSNWLGDLEPEEYLHYGEELYKLLTK